MPSWPSSFPPLFEVDGFSVVPVSNNAPIEVESGEPLTRNRFTGEMDGVTGSFYLVERDVAISMLNFWRYDLVNGSLRFTFDHPLTGESSEMLFMAAPRLTPVTGDLWRVNVQFQTMPT